jgi:hypothetical protein
MLDGMKRADFRPKSGIFRELNLEQIVLNPDRILFLLHRKPCPVPYRDWSSRLQFCLELVCK